MPAPTDPRATAVMRAALAVLVVALLALTAWQYLVPLGFEANWGLNPDAVTRFREAYGVRVPRLGAVGYRRGFHVLHVLAGTAYLALVGAGLAGGRLSRRTVLTTTIGLAVGLALVWPLSFSLDAYRYVGYARLVAVYHLNPYAANRQALLDLHDMTAKFMVYDLPSPYGPLWMWLSIAVVWVTKGTTLLAQVIALKLLAAAALVGLGRAGRALAERLEAGRGELALVAIGCNPWFLIEGPGNGHNDLVMMALVMVALVALFDGRHRVSALLVGCAAGVKFLPLMLVPWLMVSAAREAAPDRRRMAAAVADDRSRLSRAAGGRLRAPLARHRHAGGHRASLAVGAVRAGEHLFTGRAVRAWRLRLGLVVRAFPRRDRRRDGDGVGLCLVDRDADGGGHLVLPLVPRLAVVGAAHALGQGAHRAVGGDADARDRHKRDVRDLEQLTNSRTPALRAGAASASPWPRRPRPAPGWR